MANSNRILGKTLTISVILLFLGVTVNPAIATVEPEKQPDDIEGIVAQIRTVVNEILQRYGHIPMVRGLCNVIQSALGMIGLWAICNIIFVITVIIGGLLFFPLLSLGFENAALNVAVIVFLIVSELDLNCPTIWDFIPPSLKSIYSMLNVNDNIQSLDGCPCLQED